MQLRRRNALPRLQPRRGADAGQRDRVGELGPELMKMTEFRKLLGQRADENGARMTVSKLAEQACLGRSHLTSVLLGNRDGKYTRRKLAIWLTAAEIEALGWAASDRAGEQIGST